MKLILVRHCRTDWNAEHRMQGHADRRLDEHGHAQARILAEALKTSGATHVFSSDLLRAQETATYIAAALHIPLILDVRLREFSFGEFEGCSVADVDAHFQTRPGEYWLDFREYGGETEEIVRERMLAALEALRAKESVNFVPIIVSHGAALMTLHKHFGIAAHPIQGGYRIVKHHGDRLEELSALEPSAAEETMP